MRTVTATADGRADGVPDLLTAQVGISNTGGSASAVMAENNRLAEQLIARVAEVGVEPEDVATSSVDIHPEHDRDGRVIGYRASNMLTVDFRDLATAGHKLDALVEAAGDAIRIDGVSLGFNDRDALLSAARADGVRRARAQAKEMAEAAGAEIGEVITITDQIVNVPDGPRFALAAEAMSAARSRVPIAAGSRELTVQVRVVFELV